MSETKSIAITKGWLGYSMLAGVAAGMAMGIFEMMGMALSGKGFWSPLNMIAATVPAFRPPAPDFSLAPIMTGMMLHMGASAMLGVTFGLVTATLGARLTRNWGGRLALGLAWGIGAYLVMGVLIGPLLDPALQAVDQIRFFIGHLVFGATLPGALFALRRSAPARPSAANHATALRGTSR